MATGEDSKIWRYGGKFDGFLKIDGEKLGLWRGFSVSAQYERYYGSDVNNFAGTLLPVNTALSFLHTGGYHSALSLNVTQQFDESFSISVGKFNMILAPSRTPLLGGGGMDTFMNIGLAAPITGVTPPYIIGGIATLKTDPATFTLMLYDPRNAQNPRVIERPFEKGVTASLSAMIPMEIAGLRGYHTFRGAYSNKRGLDIDDIPQLGLPRLVRDIDTKKGYRYLSYSLQQNFVQSESNPAAGWGLFMQVSTSDGNPNPLKWVVIAGLAGNTLLPRREDDRWGVGYFHYGLSSSVLVGLAALGINRRSESGVEAFYNIAVTPWLRLSADLQVIEPFDANKRGATFGGFRLQTKL